MASEEAETYLRLMAEAELRRALALPEVHEYPRREHWRRVIGPGQDQQTDAYDGLGRLAAAADALVAVGAVDDEVARKTIADHGRALEVRRRLFENRLRFMFLPVSGPPAGPFRAVGIARRIGLEINGDPAEITLLALVIGPDRAVLPMVVTGHTGIKDRRGLRLADDDEDDLWFADSATAVDNNGGCYKFRFNGGGDHEECTGHLAMDPLPRAGTRWLDLTVLPGTAPIRINLDQVTPPEPAIEPLPRSELAELYLDRVAAQLLADRPWPARRLSDGVTALLGARLITPDNPAIGGLATLARRLGAALPPSLADGPDTELPERWLSVLVALGAMDGPTGVSPAAAVLPELDGSRWVIAGMRSAPDSAQLGVFGWGAGIEWHDASRLGNPPGKFSWWARDSTGRWHVASQEGGHWSLMHVDFALRLTPALHPAATSIDVVLTGKSGRVTVTLPLDWETP